jgi:O-antigen/teichoic acid export membrane protein
MLMMTYAGVAFSAMESDFFPRLSAVNNNVEESNLTINRQIEVAFLLVSPMLVAFLVAVPMLLPLLYSSKFMAAISMTKIFVFAIYIRAVKLPVAYLPLAKGDSASFLLLEAIYDVLYVAGVVVGFHYAQLTGAGLAITIVGTIDWMVIVGYAYRKYSYRLDKSIFRYMALQLPIGLTAYLLTFTSSQWLYWSVGVLLVVLSTLVSLYLLRGKLPVIGRLWLKLRRRREP